MLSRIINHYLPVTLRGVLMGAADVIPGVSGGTIAFITGIYETLITSLKSIDKRALTRLVRFEYRAFWRGINGGFLTSLLLGIVFSIVTLSKVILYLLEHHTLLLLSFFFGLIIASAIVVVRRVNAHTAGGFAACITGAVLAFLITNLSPVETPENILFVFLSGAIAICAMILPGISGSFILLLLGKYTFILTAVKDLNIIVIIAFVTGCAAGLLGFVRLLSKLLRRHHDYTMMTLSGIMIGSLTKVWPWKVPASHTVPDGEKAMLFSLNVTPDTYVQLTGSEPMIIASIMLMTVGLAFVFALEHFSVKSRGTLTDYSS